MSFFTSKRLEERKEGLEQLKIALKDKTRSLIIHYSCESFMNNSGRTPRVTSISVRNIHTAQTISFSIHLQAQIKKLDFNNLSDIEYDTLEFQMLEEFYEFAGKRIDCLWIHWNMRDSNFGFEAISNRFKILGGTPYDIAMDKRYDLPRILGKIYTYDYEDHGDNGRLLSLCERNRISDKDALNGAKEAEAFENKNYLSLHKSTLRKIEIMENILQKVDNNSLKVKASATEVYGVSILGLKEIVNNNWLLSALWSILVFILGVFCERLLF